MSPRIRTLGWAYVLVCTVLVVRTFGDGARASSIPVASTSARHNPAAATPAATAAQWFRRMKPYCNSVEIKVMLRQTPAPATLDGTGYTAACFALAGMIDDARRTIDARQSSDRYKAAGVVFDVGHPIADAGDDRSAGPIMELVIDYWPNHYMALYHAGIAEYMLGQRELARRNLEKFLTLYHENDGWRSNGIEVLNRLRDSAAARADARRPRDPGGAP